MAIYSKNFIKYMVPIEELIRWYVLKSNHIGANYNLRNKFVICPTLLLTIRIRINTWIYYRMGLAVSRNTIIYIIFHFQSYLCYQFDYKYNISIP